MKKILFITTALLFSASAANAQFAGGFEGPSAVKNATTVENALQQRDDTKVILKGNIVNSLGDEKYTFKDSTGEVVVEIDDDEWNGLKVTPENTVEIFGEVDKEWNKPTKIDVDNLKVK